MKKKVQIQQFEGIKELEGTRVDIVEAHGAPLRFVLEDGTVLKVRLVGTDVVRIDDQWDDKGNPKYILSSQNIVTIDSVPDELKRR